MHFISPTIIWQEKITSTTTTLFDGLTNGVVELNLWMQSIDCDLLDAWCVCIGICNAQTTELDLCKWTTPKNECIKENLQPEFFLTSKLRLRNFEHAKTLLQVHQGSALLTNCLAHLTVQNLSSLINPLSS